MLGTRQITGFTTVSCRGPILIHSLRIIGTLDLIIFFEDGWAATAGFLEARRDGARVRASRARCRFGRRRFRWRIAAGVLGFWIERLVRPRINSLTDELLAKVSVPVVLDLIVSPSWDSPSYQRPPVSQKHRSE